MKEIRISPIGKVVSGGGSTRIVLDPAYAAGLKGLEDYSHVQVLWWADGCDNGKDRGTLTEEKPYRNGPEELGVFALRSPERPNPVAVTNAGSRIQTRRRGSSVCTGSTRTTARPSLI